MRATQHQDYTESKQRLRTEINNHVQDFLYRGGRIDVISTGNPQARPGHRQASVELAFIPRLFED